MALLLAASVATAQQGGSNNSTKASPQARRARALFEEGIALSDEGKWPDALAAFEKSDELVPSPSARFNIGATLRALGRYVEAKQTLQRILDEEQSFKPPLKPALRKDIQKLLAEVSEKVVVIQVRTSPAAADLQVDGSPAKPLPDGRLELDPGKHVFVLSAKGHDTTTVAKTLSKGDTELAITAPKVKPVEEATPIYKKGWFWATAGGAVVASVTVIVLVVALQPEPLPAKLPPPATVDRVIPAVVRF
jgi:tetratricopeptide (TPR) repeat protein